MLCGVQRVDFFTKFPNSNPDAPPDDVWMLEDPMWIDLNRPREEVNVPYQELDWAGNTAKRLQGSTLPVMTMRNIRTFGGYVMSMTIHPSHTLYLLTSRRTSPHRYVYIDQAKFSVTCIYIPHHWQLSTLKLFVPLIMAWHPVSTSISIRQEEVTS